MARSYYKRILMAGIIATAANLPLGAGAADAATASESVAMTATVEAIDYGTRTVTLRRDDGSTETVEVSPEVKRFGEIKKGDKLRVQLSVAMAVELNRHGSTTPAQIEEHAAKAKADQPPGVTARREIKATLTVLEIDTTNNIVSVSGPQGNVAVLSVVRPEMQSFIKQLKKGDKVDVTYTEAVALALEPLASQ